MPALSVQETGTTHALGVLKLKFHVLVNVSTDIHNLPVERLLVIT